MKREGHLLKVGGLSKRMDISPPKHRRHRIKRTKGRKCGNIPSLHIKEDRDTVDVSWLVFRGDVSLEGGS